MNDEATCVVIVITMLIGFLMAVMLDVKGD